MKVVSTIDYDIHIHLSFHIIFSVIYQLSNTIELHVLFILSG
jgi:hypothetical protein